MLYLSQELILKIFFYLCCAKRVLDILLGLVLLKLRRAVCFFRLVGLVPVKHWTLVWEQKASLKIAQRIFPFPGR